jgi:hypothetical protein
MARSSINDPKQDQINDNGGVLVSVVRGDQLHIDLTLSWITDLTGYTLTATVIEAANDGTGSIPSEPQPAGQTTSLTILDSVVTDNQITLVIPSDLIANYAVKPEVGKPVYGFISLTVADTGVGTEQVILKPYRGLVEVLYSVTGD